VNPFSSKPSLRGLYFGFDRSSYYGKKVGYDLLANAVNQLSINQEAAVSFRNSNILRTQFPRLSSLDTLVKRVGGAIFHRRIARNLKGRQFDYAHVLWADFTSVLSHLYRSHPTPVIATIHRPPKYWTVEELKRLQNVDALIALYGEGASSLQEIYPRVPVYFTRYGVETSFFTPSIRPRQSHRILCVGRYLRDFQMLREILQYFLTTDPMVHFDLVIPINSSEHFLYQEYRNHPRVTWLTGLTDEELRDVYCRATIMCLPVVDGGANNAVVEALATGTPILSTDFKGIRDYGGGDWIVTVPCGDTHGMIQGLQNLTANQEILVTMGERGRQFAVTLLDWSVVAKKHLDIYWDVVSRHRSTHVC
jgi:glycosyltransferase involved in cell wall biosynthesis